MSLFRIAKLCAVTIVAFAGCQSMRTDLGHPTSSPNIKSEAPSSIEQWSELGITTVSLEKENPATQDGNDFAATSDAELSLAWLIDEVQTRNPSLQAMVAAWQAAAQRYPQAVSLEDPMFMAMVAPESFDSPIVDPGYALQASQKFPWFGKRAARGRQARANATAAYQEVEDSRLRLEEITRTAFYDYYLARRQLNLNRENLEVVGQFRSTAQSRYQANQVTQQDVLQAEVELAELERRTIELERIDRLARARINTLLRQDPFTPLPPPSQQLDTPTLQINPVELQQIALSQRPDLAALAARIRAEQAAVTLACKDYYPDTELFGRYDAFWQEEPLQTAVGMNLNVPIYRGRLNAAVREARFTLNQRRAEYEQLALNIQYEVAAAYEEVEESRRVLNLYTERLLPTAEQNVAAARANYDVARGTFLDLATAQRQLIELRERREEALAAYYSRLAALARAIGGPIQTIEVGQEVPPSN
jgi:cobalt-zinc-cadmium efflux system outer membrane protein